MNSNAKQEAWRKRAYLPLFLWSSAQRVHQVCAVERRGDRGDADHPTSACVVSWEHSCLQVLLKHAGSVPSIAVAYKMYRMVLVPVRVQARFLATVSIMSKLSCVAFSVVYDPALQLVKDLYCSVQE